MGHDQLQRGWRHVGLGLTPVVVMMAWVACGDSPISSVAEGASVDSGNPSANDANAGAPTGDGDTSGGDAAVDGDTGALVCNPITWDGSYDLPASGVCSIHGACTVSPGSIATNLQYAWAAGTGDYWFASDTAVMHFGPAGSRGRTALPDGPGFIHGSGTNDVWIGTLHWDGLHLTNAVKPPAPGKVWMHDAADGWSTNGTKMSHWDGAKWVDFTTPAAFPLKDVWGYASNDVYAVGGPGAFHWDGASWSATTPALPAGGTADAIWGLPGPDIWVQGDVLRRLVGGAWQTVAPPSAGPSGAKASSVATDGAGTIRVAFGATPGQIYTRSGDGWLSSPTYLADYVFTASAFVPGGQGVEIFAGPFDCFNGGGKFASWGVNVGAPFGVTGGSACVPTTPGVTSPPLLVSPSGNLYHLPGALPPGLWGVTNQDTPVGLSGTPDDDIWLTGYYQSTGLASHWDGAAWTYKTLPAVPTSAVHARSSTSAWVVAGGGAYFDGVTWVLRGAYSAPVVATKPVGIWGSGADFAVVVYGNGSVRVWNGAGWTSKMLPTGALALGGTTAPLVVGSAGAVYRWNGTDFVDLGVARPAPLLPGVFVTMAGDTAWLAMFAPGAGIGTSAEPGAHYLWRFDGCWTPILTGYAMGEFSLVGGSPDGKHYVALGSLVQVDGHL